MQKTVKKARRTAQNLGDHDLVKSCNIAIAAINELANLMDTGRAVRVVADYNPEITIQFKKNSRFNLNGVPITEADNSPVKTSTYCKEIEAVLTQINV